jgi:small subunit ribosomal protein S6
MSETRQYELVYVVSPETDEDGVAGLHAQIAEIVEKQEGQIEKTDNWGRRQMAYEINRHREGTYVLELINGPGELVRELDRRLRVNDTVLRHLIVRVDEDLRKARRARENRQSRVQRRRAARGLTAPETAPAAEVVEVAAATEAGGTAPADGESSPDGTSEPNEGAASEPTGTGTDEVAVTASAGETGSEAAETAPAEVKPEPEAAKSEVE